MIVRPPASRRSPLARPSARTMAWLAGCVAAGVCAGLTVVAMSCSPARRHDVLTFFFDGVPPMGSGNAPSVSGDGTDATATAESAPGAVRGKARVVFYNHEPYFENRCGECHDRTGTGLLMSPRAGLCLSCHHENFEEDAKFVHGPVVVNGCTQCHLYHRSRYKGLLVDEPQKICIACHPTDTLTTGQHHATMDEKRCIDCHDPHGGDDRYFLKPGGRPDMSIAPPVAPPAVLTPILPRPRKEVPPSDTDEAESAGPPAPADPVTP